jgi:CRP-like cAMP-binding protein
VDSSDGREVVLTHLQAGNFFGEMALFEGESRSASVSALTESELVVLTRTDFLNLLEHDFTLTRKILKTLSARLRRANDVIESLALLDVGGRLARYLLRLADESGKPPVDGYFVVSRPTHQEIANSIGATRETVTRMLKQFEDRKLIRVQGSTVPKVLRKFRGRGRTSGDASEGSLDPSQLHHPPPARGAPVLPARHRRGAFRSRWASSWRRASPTGSTASSRAASTCARRSAHTSIRSPTSSS